jgi:tetratricopeptide (TPR) repeat protein
MDTLDFDRLWNFADPAATEAKFREIRPGLAADHTRLLELDTQIARAQGLQKQFDAALATLEGVRAALTAAPRPCIRYLLELGRVLRSSGKPDDARPRFEAAAAQAEAAGETALAIDARHMIALVEPDAQQRLALNLASLQVAEASTDPQARAWRASLLNNIGLDHQERGELDASLAAFERALTLLLPTKNSERIAIGRWSVAWVMRLQDRLAQALAMQEELAREHESAGTPDGYVFEELGEIHLALSNRDLACGYFGRAAEALKEELAGTERLTRIRRLAEGTTE